MSKDMTISFRVTADQKMKLLQKSEELGLKLTNYIELLVLEGFDRYCQEPCKQSFTDVNDEVTNSESLSMIDRIKLDIELIDDFQNHLSVLKKRHPNYSDEIIMTACLRHADKNYKALFQKSLKSFLKDFKQNKDDK